MTRLSEKIIEAGARAFLNVSEGTDAFWQSYSEEMRSALLAVLPMVAEEIDRSLSARADAESMRPGIGGDLLEMLNLGLRVGQKGAAAAFSSLIEDLK